ncbi:MAG: hypothetical protein ACSHW1_15485 [Yoonia sp.]|uniref:hypothetical protein n=1 Tax=Yoonia sp. TaxID=2212373 RepID=UPI003EF309D4
MNMNRLINMGLRMLMNKGINKGIDLASRRGKALEDMTPEERASAQANRQTGRKARRNLNMLRRFMR